MLIEFGTANETAMKLHENSDVVPISVSEPRVIYIKGYFLMAYKSKISSETLHFM